MCLTHPLPALSAASMLIPFLFRAVVLRPDVQQPVAGARVQERRPVRHQQAEQNVVQGLQTPQVPCGRHVQEWIKVSVVSE